VGRWVARFAGSFSCDWHGATAANKQYLTGISEALVDEWEQSLGPEFFRRDARWFFEEALQQIAWHSAQGHSLFLVSGTLAPLARLVARSFAARAATDMEVCATELEVAPGARRIWNGRICCEHMSGGAKLRAVTELAARSGIDLARSYAYGDSAGDLAMLGAVGNAVAVNPTARLARVAHKHGWQTRTWEKTLGEIPNATRRSWWREAWRACGAFEWVTFGYLGWMFALLGVFHRNIPHAARYFAIDCGIASGILWLASAAARSEHHALQFARHWYPLPLYVFFFEELQGLVHAIFPAWFDRWLIAFDYNFGGVHPAAWLGRFATPGLNDFMQFAYMTYFLYLVILPGILYVQGKRAAFWTVMVATAIAHYSVYVFAVLFPVESPYFALASLQLAPLKGGASTAVIEFIERFGRVHGAAFPSAHVAGSLVALLAARRYKAWLFWIYLPFFLSMCVATVYGRYHYIADVLAGIVVGATGWVIGQWLMEREGATKRSRAYRTDAADAEKSDGKSAAGLTHWQAGAQPLPERRAQRSS
jgi:HAD superfamily phosphoserine phosphatase-like hydrolase